MDVLITIHGRVKNIMWERLRRTIKSNRITYKIALNLVYTKNILNMKTRNLWLYREYKHLKFKRKFYSRIKQIDPDKYLDTKHKPNLNVIILVVDSLRNSRLSSQEYFRETTPFLDSLKTRFTAISASSWTYPSVASILTGLYPHNHKAVLAGRIKDIRNLSSIQNLRRDILSLPDILLLLGYKIYFSSAIISACRVGRSTVIPKDYDPDTRADELLDDLTKWIAKNRKKKLFAYVHLADLHVPLNPPDSFRSFFGDVKNLPKIDTWDFSTVEQQKAGHEMFQEYKENRELLYDNLLRYTDHVIEGFYHSLKDMGLLDSTILIVTADHGEEFWDHAELQAGSFYNQGGSCGVSHGQAGFRELIEVPLLMTGRVPARKGTGFVSAVDIVPTIVDLLGISHKIRFDGRNIFKTEGERPLLSEASISGYEKKALVVDRYKLIYSKDDGIEWVFDLEKDPEEQHPIVDKEVTSIFVEKLHQILREDEKRKIREIAGKKSLSKLSDI